MTNPSAVVGEVWLDPPALEPFPVRRTLLAFLAGLALVLHVGTAGYGNLEGENDNPHVADAREMLVSGDWLPSGGSGELKCPPLLSWMMAAGMQLFGCNTFAMRLPVAAAVVVWVMLAFLFVERLSGTWRGFAAGLALLTCSGSFVFGRMLHPAPVFACILAGAFYCLLRAFERRSGRRKWFDGFWLCVSLGVLCNGLWGLLHPLLCVGILLPFYREARIRFRGLLSWRGMGVFLAPLCVWLIAVKTQSPGVLSGWWQCGAPGLFGEMSPEWDGWFAPGLGTAAWLCVGWLPWSVAVGIPALPFLRRVRWNIEPTTALAWAWGGVAMVLLFLPAPLRGGVEMIAGPVVAAGVVAVWTGAGPVARLLGAGAVTVLGLGALASVCLWEPAPPEIRPVLGLAFLSLVIFGAIAMIALFRGHARMAFLSIAAAMVPVGFCLIEGMRIVH